MGKKKLLSVMVRLFPIVPKKMMAMLFIITIGMIMMLLVVMMLVMLKSITFVENRSLSI